MDRAQIESLAKLSGFSDLGKCEFEQIRNGYWPSHPDYDQMRELHPWWRITTEFGTVVVGRRKKVFEINWNETSRRGIVTDDDVTKDNTMVHAWSIGDAVNYMRKILTLPIVDVTLPDFKEYDCTKFEDINMIIRRFSDTTTIEFRLMIALLDTYHNQPSPPPISLSIASKNGVKVKDRFVLHVGDLRIEWMTKRNV